MENNDETKYYEIVSFEHDNAIYNTYAEAHDALINGAYRNDYSSFIAIRRI